MESRGASTNEQSASRPAVGRRSCDQCRARKIGCDRGSSCSNCVSARVVCTYSAVASNATTPKQRVLISAQYEQKIDDIARDIEDVKLLLRGPAVPLAAKHSGIGLIGHHDQPDSTKPLTKHRPINPSCGEPLWDHSAHVVDFVKAVVEDRGSRNAVPEATEVLSSLRNLVQTLEEPSLIQDSSFLEATVAETASDPDMPPLEAVVTVLRWAKDRGVNTRIAWIYRILPLPQFAEICRKVYFAVDRYDEIDLILANGYLYYLFSEHVAVTELQDYLEYCQLCRNNLYTIFRRLPLLLPASMEAIAALALGSFNAIENSKATMAWTFISAASNLCQTLGYHRLRSPRENDQPLRVAQERLFWTVYEIDKGLSFRLGRSSNIRDAEITLPFDGDAPRNTRLARIQGRVYDQLHSSAALSCLDNESGYTAEALAGEVRELIEEIRAELFGTTDQPSKPETDPLRVFYLQCDLVCQYSLFVSILRAIPTARDFLSGVPGNCIAVARDALDLHQQCVMSVRGCKRDPSMMTKYINWAIQHIPFVPFSILFTRAVHLRDAADLARLDRFAASLQPEVPTSNSITHPYRLYELLCRAVRLYIDSNNPFAPADPALTDNLLDYLDDFDVADFGVDLGAVDHENLEAGIHSYGLNDWLQDHQQAMNLADEDGIFNPLQ